MNYAYLFSGMGTALLYFIYKTICLHRSLSDARKTVIGIALGEVEVKVNHETKQIKMIWKEEK